MDNYHKILNQLNAFTTKYYTKLLINGLLLFLALGLLFFLLILGIEYFFWLNSTGRLLLLLLFISIELVLLIRFIIIPLIYIFRIKKGLSYKQASLLIGKHFKEIDDKLYNLIDLAENRDRSELLLASIEQRSKNLTVIPFVKAINLNESIKYAKYILIPISIFGIIWVFGDVVSFVGSYKRVVNYDMAYEPPAPFSFHLLTTDLRVLDKEAFTINVTTEGKIKPEGITILVEGKEFMLKEQNGIYQYVFSPPLKTTTFSFTANGIHSKTYELNVVNTPTIEDFEMELTFPAYTKKSINKIKGTGNTTIPEGTKIEWKVNALYTDELAFTTKDSIYYFNKNSNEFNLNQKVYKDSEYSITASNLAVKDYEKLNYSLTVIKDAHPTIRVKQVLDSLNPNISYYRGEATDDYALSKIQLVYYPSKDNSKIRRLELSNPNQNYLSFYYTFPSGLDLEKGKEYTFYFEALDNDAINNSKSAKSQIFTTEILKENELLDRNIKAKKELLSNMDRNMEKFKEQEKSLEQIKREQKEKESLSFNDNNKIQDFLKKQEQQEQLMQRFRKELKENLQQTDKEDQKNKLLQERLERQEIEARKNEKLLEELKKISQKITKEELTKRLEEMGKNQKNSQRNLEQLLELTKRYYVEEKINQLGNKLKELSKEQETLAEENEPNLNAIDKQESLNKKFEEISKELEEVQKDNESLKKPMSLEIDENKTEAVKKDQEDALEELEQNKAEKDSEPKKANKAKSKQKSAAQKMKELGEQLAQSAASSSQSDIMEDSRVLRQILDNLLHFSFQQEDLHSNLGEIDITSNLFSGTLKRQQELRELFNHVDDSLFSLSLRQIEISEIVNKQITEVYYNIDNALESLAESQFQKGASDQKYVLTATNELAALLASILENMQQQMQSGSGGGGGSDDQLPDIILGQQELQKKMEGLGKQPKKDGKEGDNGENGKEGESSPGENGTSGEGKKGKKKGEGEGESGGDGNQPTEAELQEIYDIYKEQQRLREQLENQLKSILSNEERKLGEKLAKQMEEFQNQLLENGVTQETLDLINNINYELLKLENASMKQGEKEERESRTAEDKFQNPLLSTPEVFKKTNNDVEILNRQALPLRQTYKNKVKEYFKTDD
ncbi:MAG: DUF4175 family protein [Arenibacter latericius]|nr:DUF4175 family protein [Arenibacter latericius]